MNQCLFTYYLHLSGILSVLAGCKCKASLFTFHPLSQGREHVNKLALYLQATNPDKMLVFHPTRLFGPTFLWNFLKISTLLVFLALLFLIFHLPIPSYLISKFSTLLVYLALLFSFSYSQFSTLLVYLAPTFLWNLLKISTLLVYLALLV